MNNDYTLIANEGTCHETVVDLGNGLIDDTTKYSEVYDDFILKKALGKDDLYGEVEVNQDLTKPYRIVFHGELTHE